MREQDFRLAMKRQGKKDNVVDKLVSQIMHFESYLRESHRKSLEDATEENLSAYLAVIDPREIKLRMRSIAIYYSFVGKGKLAAVARDIRQKMTTAAQRPFRLKDFRGVDKKYVSVLEKAGIKDVESMLKAGRTPGSRRELSELTGIPIAALVELVKLSDLSRLEGVKGIRARLYHDAGTDTVEKLAAYEPEELLLMLKDFVTRTGFNGIAPLPKEVRGTISRARILPRVVEYD